MGGWDYKGDIEMKREYMEDVVKYLELMVLVRELNDEILRIEVEVDREENDREEVNCFYEERREIFEKVGWLIYDINEFCNGMKSSLWEWWWENDNRKMEKRDWKYLRGCWKKFLDECEKRGLV